VREEIGDTSQAIDAYRQALRLNPNYNAAREGLARLQGSGTGDQGSGTRE